MQLIRVDYLTLQYGQHTVVCMVRIDTRSLLLMCLLGGPLGCKMLVFYVKDKVGGKMTVSLPTAYEFLRKLQAEGMVEAVEREKPTGKRGPAKHLFQLTWLGRQRALEVRNTLRLFLEGDTYEGIEAQQA